MKNLDYVLNKIVYLKSHAINMMFKDAVVLKKEQLSQDTIDKGMRAFKEMMKNGMKDLIKQQENKKENQGPTRTISF